MRLYDLKGPFGFYGLWFDYATSKGGTVVPASTGGTAPPGTVI